MAQVPKSSTVGNSEKAHLYSAAPVLEPDFLVEQLPLVRNIAQRIHRKLPKSVSMEDLVNAGVIGLLHAARNFDDTKHVEFGLYAKFRIRGAILDNLREMDWGPRRLRRQFRRLEEAHHHLSVSLGRLPTEAELAAELRMSLDDFQVLTRDLSGLAICSLDSTFTNRGEQEPLCDRLASCKADLPDDSCLRSEMRELLERVIAELPETARRVVMHYYFDDLTMKEVGRILGVGESRVSQIHTAAIGLLRVRLEEMNGLPVNAEPPPGSGRHSDHGTSPTSLTPCQPCCGGVPDPGV